MNSSDDIDYTYSILIQPTFECLTVFHLRLVIQSPVRTDKNINWAISC